MLSAVVTDGVTMGHPCCNEHDCKVPLRKAYDEFCPVHESLNSICCIKDCPNPRLSGSKSCADSTHKTVTDDRLKKMKRKKRRHPSIDYGTGSGMHEHLRGSRAKSVKGVFRRRWTHNEQLMVRPCGVVVGRATFFASESLSGVKVWITCLTLFTSAPLQPPYPLR